MAVDWLKLSQLITGYEQLHEFNLYQFTTDLNQTIFDFICNRIKSDYSSTYEQESLTCAEAKRKIFNLCLSVNCNLTQRQGTKSPELRCYLIELIDSYIFSNDKKQVAFFTYFKNEICSWLCRRHESIVKYLFSKLSVNFTKTIGLLITLMEFLISDKNLRKQHGTKIVENLYENWSFLRQYWQPDSLLENKLILINLLAKSMQIESVVATPVTSKSTENTSIKNVAEMFMSLLIDVNTKLSFKCKLFDLLYFFCDSPAPYLIKAHLNQFLTQLPLRSKELVKHDDNYNDYVSIIRKMLVSLGLSMSTDLLAVLVTIVCREPEHICDEEVKASFISFIKHLESSKQASLVQFYWENWSKNENNDERKYIMFRKVLIVFLEHCEKPIFMDFMCANIMFMIKTLDAEIKENQFEGICMNKKNVFEILQLAYKRLYKDETFFVNSRLCMTFEREKFGQLKDGKELTKEVLRKCRKFLCEEIKQSLSSSSPYLNVIEQNLSAERQMHCAAYNCLVSLFIRTQTEPKLYHAFLFKDEASKCEFIFEQLVDKKKQYKFEIESDSLQEKKTKFVSLRNEFRELNAPGGSSTDINYINSMQSNSMATNQVTYLNTQNMYESSLGAELSAYDFTGTTGKNTLSMISPSFNTSGILGSLSNTQLLHMSLKRKMNSVLSFNHESSDDSVYNSHDANIEIEIDELNQNESMCSFVELIQSLVANKITPVYEKGHVPSDMPPWMTFLHKKVQDIYTHENVKLFIIRGIINVSHVFKR
jgi:DNA-dependent protein kinase catalytic subunit